MQIGLIIQHRYPRAVAFVDHEVREDAEGRQYVAFWDESVLGPRPTEEQLRSWWLTAEKWAKKRQIAVDADGKYDALLAPDGVSPKLKRDKVIQKKAVADSGGNPRFDAAEQTLSTRIDALRARHEQKEQEIEAVQQQPGEPLEAAVGRVRAVSW